MSMTTSEIRTAFLEFFRSHGHQVVTSGSLVPDNDPTLLFTNAGMNQFKDVFLGIEQRPYTKATTSQRCVRAGGKHNDLDNVGYTARHHTFFEMLGNFSFGDYFKRDAIRFAWTFLTQELGIPGEKLWVTVFDEDDEAAQIWLDDIGVDPNRLSRIGAKDNFWQMGDTGPCGPCTEIFYDHGEEVAGGPPGTPEEDGDRYIEIWNIVFMQYNRLSDGTLEPLPKPSVDTGMGLERLAAVIQGMHSNYEIDLFQALIQAAARIVNTNDLQNKSLRVIADHIRSCAFLIGDGVMPSNEGRGYVLRRIIRRAVRHGRKLGANELFFYKLVDVLCELMADAYPELKRQKPVVERVLQLEEEQFVKTLDRGLGILEDALTSVEGVILPGDLVFKLYDTYGFPADLTADVVRDRGYRIDEEGFAAAMADQRARAKQASQFSVDYNECLRLEHKSEFTGYDGLLQNSKIIGVLKGEVEVDAITEGEDALLVLDVTPFYAESGGQLGDGGLIRHPNGVFAVTDTQKIGGAVVHKGYMELGSLRVNDVVEAEVDEDRRRATALNHSATHLLHAALRHVLGDHVTQKGSQVGPERLRFDFSHFEGVSNASLRALEALVNEQIRGNSPVDTQVMELEEAQKSGAMALFGEKYEDKVRVVRMGEFSTELCGGTHVQRTGDIGMFRIMSEGGIAAGIRRIEAVTGVGAIDCMHQLNEEIEQVMHLVKGDQFSLAARVHQIMERSRLLEREIEQLKAKLTSRASSGLLDQVVEIKGIKVLVACLLEADPKSLRQTLDELKNKLGETVIVLATRDNKKVSLIAGVTPSLTQRVKAGELVNMVAQQVGGKGGGRPDMAQAGGSEPQALDGALASVASWLEARL